MKKQPLYLSSQPLLAADSFSPLCTEGLTVVTQPSYQQGVHLQKDGMPRTRLWTLKYPIICTDLELMY